MISWPTPFVPAVPGTGAELFLHDQRTDSLRPVRPGRVARIYACGVTPYDSTHLGHAATYVAGDLLHRTLLDAGHEILSVQNITDIDDPLLERADRDGVDWQDLATASITLFRDDMTALAVIPPTHYLGVVESMSVVVAAVRSLVDRGLTYALTDDSGARDVYLDLSMVSAPAGALSGLDHEAMVGLSHARGGDPDRPGKRDPIDPLLWRGERSGEPAWDGGDGLGRGRPGWHIECTALALEHLGAPFDVQIGGHDLVFPHHEMSALQSVALTGAPTYADHHLYQALVAYDGEKMSKSKGNLVFVSALRESGVDPMVIRALILGQHYRREWEYTDDLLRAAEARVARWREALSVNTGPDAQGTIDRIRAALADDLDGPSALEALDAWADRTLTAGGHHDDGPGLVSRAMDALLGLRL
ncbi:cysteine--1-D-myo-inosityl 2-amino-2-deoxy-alpha-D-glucopyranoside ligase [Nostocoides sp. F2B08]|uniref:cysteine--1-D-myo-inosityl 2-amino-2-deoxy-alpha-D-glucopyranoside ligase n=1 Tax=Nostocoides sp. F2B08 TaxID=2653936 RepID=UPI00126340FE|nr:cysteine--1-D-myo-inosityl 2-amino-2-deoxy-alpha-D-glucopyranoside ligase [Tetrasphaera sp. F2B08]KAB7742958.1 cysteine--1-D-myo-inosityl 2-amino-2-deoxy-alpha-D-glucopyranoside ligase [Tetrasphaera sp. F2B08]